MKFFQLKLSQQIVARVASDFYVGVFFPGREYRRVQLLGIIEFRYKPSGITVPDTTHDVQWHIPVIMREMAPSANGFFKIYFFAHLGAISPMGAILRIRLR